MLDIVHEHLDKVLGLYTQGAYFTDLKSAKEKYFSITGKLDEDKDEFEPRMNCFNDWYIFQFRHNDGYILHTFSLFGKAEVLTAGLPQEEIKVWARSMFPLIYIRIIVLMLILIML